jgi:hypothetical protein
LRIWESHIPVSAVKNFGFSDSISVSLSDARGSQGASITAPVFNDNELTEAERACPVSILKPARSLRGH